MRPWCVAALCLLSAGCGNSSPLPSQPTVAQPATLPPTNSFASCLSGTFGSCVVARSTVVRTNGLVRYPDAPVLDQPIVVGGSVQLNWSPVRTDTNGSPLDSPEA